MRKTTLFPGIMAGLVLIAGTIAVIFHEETVTQQVKAFCGVVDPTPIEMYGAAYHNLYPLIGSFAGDGWDSDEHVAKAQIKVKVAWTWAEALPQGDAREEYLRILAARQREIDEALRVGAAKRAERRARKQRIDELATCLPQPPGGS